MKFSVVLILLHLVLALEAQGPSAQDNSTTEDDYIYMSGSGLGEEEFSSTMDTMTLLPATEAVRLTTVISTGTNGTTEATTMTATTRMNVITTSNTGATMDTLTSANLETTVVYRTEVMMTSQVPEGSVHASGTMTAAAATSSLATTRSMADRTAADMSSSAKATSMVDVNPTVTGSPPTRPTSTNITTPTNTKPTVPAPTDSGHSTSGITSAGFGIGWIIGFVIGVLLTFVIETSIFLYWRNKRRHTHPSPSGQGVEYFEMSSDMMKHHSEVHPDDNGGHTPDVKKPLIEP